jgi:putative transposase
MTRIARAIAVGAPHHVTQRGNNRQTVFFTDDDRLLYLQILRKNAERCRLRIMAYCLMSNHVHLVAIPDAADALAKALGRTHHTYTRTINLWHKRSGHLWQNRFFSCPLDQAHYWAAARYVERNPVRAGLVREAWRYPWSSAAAHVTGHDIHGVLDMAGWPHDALGEDWRGQLVSPEDGEMLLRLRDHTHRGHALGGDGFVSKLETLLNRRLRPGVRGRPRVHDPGYATPRKKKSRKGRRRRNGRI